MAAGIAARLGRLEAARRPMPPAPALPDFDPARLTPEERADLDAILTTLQATGQTGRDALRALSDDDLDRFADLVERGGMT